MISTKEVGFNILEIIFYYSHFMKSANQLSLCIVIFICKMEMMAYAY